MHNSVRRGWISAFILSVLWGVVPAVPALLSGQLLGHPWTDLYPSVWGMWWFASEQSFVIPTTLPMFAEGLGAPGGIPFFYSSTIHGVLATPLLSILSVVDTWNILTILARIGTVLAAYAAAKAWGLKSDGALVAAAVFGCSPFFHGYAVEGIVEGVDGWPIALWLWAVGRRRQVLAGIFFGLTIVSSFYMAATAMVLALFIGPRCWAGVALGLVLSSPVLYGFSTAFSGDSSVSPEVRSSMGTSISLWSPALFTDGIQPFAKSSWLGFTAGILATISGLKYRKAGALALFLWLLSFGIGPLYNLPLFSELRFPYRFHAGTLIVMALLIGRWSEGPKIAALKYFKGWVLVAVIVTEGFLLSPIEPIIPGSPGDVSEVHSLDTGSIVLDIPGPVAMEPNVRNPSRIRARHFLYGQTLTGTRSPWVPDFNSIGVVSVEEPELNTIRHFDPLVSEQMPESLPSLDWVDGIILHPDQLGGRAERIEQILLGAGWRQTLGEFPSPVLYTRP